MTEKELTTLYRTAKICRAGKNKLRSKIIETLRKHGKLTVGELHIKCKTDQPTMSGQLRILKDAGFVTGVRAGKSVVYSVNETYLEKVISVLDVLNEI